MGKATDRKHSNRESRRQRERRRQAEKQALKDVKASYQPGRQPEPEPRKTDPAPYVLLARALWAGVAKPTKVDNLVQTVDQEICDPLGQLYSLGLFEGHCVDGQELRDVGRFWGEQFRTRYRTLGPKIQTFERRDKSDGVPPMTADERRFLRMNEALDGYEQTTLYDLIVAPLLGEGVVPWALSQIGFHLLNKHNRLVPWHYKFPDSADDALLATTVRGLLVLRDAGLAMPLRNKIAA